MTQARVAWKEGASFGALPLSGWPVVMSTKTVLIGDQWGGVLWAWACHLWADDIGLFKKARQESYERQASNKHFPMVSASVPAPSFLEHLSWLPSMMKCNLQVK